MKMTKVLAIALAGSLLSAPAAADGGTLQIAWNKDMASTNPGVDRTTTTDIVLLHVVEGLVGYKEDLSVGPSLAESFTVSDGGRTYTFKLRDGVTFHNGEPLTSADVKWSWDRLMDEETKWLCRSRFVGDDAIKVLAVETPDDDTVVFRLEEASPLFLKQLARFDCGSAPVLHRDSVNSDGSWNSPIGTGPFKLAEWLPGQRIVLERVDDYVSSTRPKDGYTGERNVLVDRVVWNIVPDASSIKAALRSGEADFTLLDLPSDADEMGAAGLNIVTQVTPGWGSFAISRHDPIMKNKKLRQAMAHALDMDTLVETLGFGKHYASPIAPMSSFHTEVQSKTYGYDVEKAKQLLKEANYNGEPIVMLATRKIPSFYNATIAAQSMWKKAGINVEIEVNDLGSQFERYDTGEFMIQSLAYSPRFDPAQTWGVFTGPGQGMMWANPEAIELVSVLNTETDFEKREAASNRLQELFLEDVPVIGLYFETFNYALSPRLKGFESWAAGMPRMWGVSLSD